MSRLLHVRHCASSGQHPEAPLTGAGLAQADALADHLAVHPIDRLVASTFLGCSPSRGACSLMREDQPRPDTLPWDAYCGRRYACVLDRDGNQIELFADL